MASMRVCDAMLVALSTQWGTTVGDASRVVAAFALAYGTLQLFYGPLGERLGKLRVVHAAVWACALCSGLAALSPHLDALVMARVLMGASAAGIIPLCLAWIGDKVPYAQRQETLAGLMSATVTGMMCGQWLGGWAAQAWGWRSAFVVLAAAFALVAGLLGWRMALARAAEPRQQEGSYWSSAREGLALWALPRVRWVLAMVTLEGALAFGALAFAPSVLELHFGLSPTGAGGMMVLYGLGGLLYSQGARRWLGWWGERGLARVGAAGVAAGLLLLAWSTSLVWAGVGCALSGLGFYMLHNTLQMQATQMAPHARASAVTWFACCLFFGQSAGVMAVATLVDGQALSWAYTACAVGMVLLGVQVAGRVSRKGQVQEV